MTLSVFNNISKWKLKQDEEQLNTEIRVKYYVYIMLHYNTYRKNGLHINEIRISCSKNEDTARVDSLVSTGLILDLSTTTLC